MENKQKQKKISIGVEDFKTLIDWNGYFVDKTLMIKELIESNAKVTLFYPAAPLRQDAQSVYDPALL